MTSTPDRSRVPLLRISPRAYEHPADRTALTALRAVPGFETVLRALSGVVRERSLRLMFLATTVRASDRQFRHLHHAVVDGSRILDLPTTPEIFVTNDPTPHALTLGMETPFLVVSTGLLDLLDGEELRFTIGHELGHVLSGHAVYRTMMFQLAGLARDSPGCRWAAGASAPSSSRSRSGPARPSCRATGPACSPVRTRRRRCGR
jgi:Zn-dependent protease with chaperone function